MSLRSRCPYGVSGFLSRSRCPVYYVLCPMPYFLYPMSYFLCPMSYVLCPVPYVLCPMPYVLCRCSVHVFMCPCAHMLTCSRALCALCALCPMCPMCPCAHMPTCPHAHVPYALCVLCAHVPLPLTCTSAFSGSMAQFFTISLSSRSLCIRLSLSCSSWKVLHNIRHN
jgi:hypothetical protein